MRGIDGRLREILEANYSPDQLRAVTSTGPVTVVKAGAGTGKTHTLSGRVAYLMATQEGLELDQVAVLTFTEKAAQEMGERIRDILLHWGRELKMPRLEEASRRVGEAYISTIHSFALRLIRENPAEAKLPVDASVAPRCSTDEFRAELAMAFDEMDLRWFTSRLPQDWVPLAQEALSSGWAVEMVNRMGPEELAGLCLEASDTLGATGRLGPKDLWDLTVTREDLKRLVRDLLGTMRDWLHQVGQAIHHLGSVADLPKGELPQLLEEIRREDPALEELLEAVEMGLGLQEVNLNKTGYRSVKEELHQAVEEMGLPWVVPSDKNGPFSVFKKKVKERLSTLTGLCHLDLSGQGEVRLWRELNRLVALGWQAFDHMRLSSGQLSFQDLISTACGLLEGEGPSPFKHVLIDEFQDTDGVQFRLAEALMRRGAHLFVVGDLKQSIYRFRNADLSLFDKVIRLAPVVVSLAESRRSTPQVIDLVNRIFGSAFAHGIDPSTSEEYEPLRPLTEDRSDPLPVVVTPDEGAQSKGEVLRSACASLAKEFLRMHREGHPVRDREGTRPCRWSDFAVLVPTRGSYQAVSAALEDLNIPHALCSSMDFASRFESRDLEALVAALGGDRSPLGALKVAMSPLFGQRMYHLRQSEVGSLAKAGGEVISSLSPISDAAGASWALDHLFKPLHWLSNVRGQDRTRVLLNLRHARELLMEYEAHMGPGAQGAGEYLTQALGNRVEEPEIPPDDAVRVMTVHAAKGLEFPITAVLLKPSQRGGNGDRYRISRRLLAVPSSSLVEDAAGEEGVLAKASSLLEESAEAWESLRLFYVACTRARDRLILVMPDGKDRWGQEVTRALGEDAVRSLRIETPPQAPVERGAESGIGTQPVDAPSRAPALVQMSATSYSLFKFCPAAYRMTFRQGLDPKWGGDFVHRGPGGADLGTLAHWIMSRWDGDPDTIRGAILREEVPQEVLMALEDPGLPELMGWLRDFARSPLGERFRDLLRRGAGREVPFRVTIQGGFRMVGAMDLYLDDPSGPVIRDYKITHQDNPIQELYRHQMLFYGLAVRRITRRDPDMAIWRLRPQEGSFEEIPVETPDWDRMEEELLQVARKAASGPFDGNPGRCPGCPWKMSCAR
ncbi:Exodeoxyribonuclease V [Thermanaerovibrio acidaminovorans DSM 6589]|uniref:DNA 3'-5' helicase n=1 Tax=Thermanaerovibrio acidaminovorans (strain ATCC 49978 / DSM 6589 / Su883) TaxID=525903 RepID=D1B7B6_THEAS|nr:UvrD-helicase domain-containing protein [Thermanaerovibrio acidaminovorans]ACZ19907.1 Exodeoxyribonuclease V [Thermanaerovibrio acidaminovorans DSM 6589]